MIATWLRQLAQRKSSSSQSSRSAARRPTSFRPQLETLEMRLAPANRVWSGLGATSNWSDRFNWIGQVAPVANDALVFPLVAQQRTNQNNDLAEGTRFVSITYDGSGYSAAGNGIKVAAIEATNLFGNNSLSLDITLDNTSGLGVPITVTDADAGLGLHGSVSGTATHGLIKQGAGALFLGGFSANTYAGITRVEEGTLAIGKSSGLGSTSGGTIVFNGATLRLVGQNFGFQGIPVNVGAEELQLGTSTSGTARLLSTPPPLSLDGNSWAGRIQLLGDHVIEVESGLLTLTGNVTDFLPSSGPGVRGGLIKEGPGVLRLAHANTYSEATTVAQGTLRVTNGASLGSTLNGTTVESGAILELQGTFTVGAEALTIEGGATTAVHVLSGNPTWQGPVNLLDPGRNLFNVDAGSNLTLSGVVSGNALSKAGLGKLTLANNNQYTGLTALAEGVLNIQRSSALGPAGAAGVHAGLGTTLELQGGISVGDSLDLAGGTLRNVSGTNSWTGAVNLLFTSTVAVVGGQLTISGVITGSNIGFTKAGGTSLFLTGNNTYTGTTTVTAGSLFVNGSQPNSPVNVTDGRLGGVGTVGPITNTGGILGPGVNVGRLTTIGNLSLGSGGLFEVALNGTAAGTTHDQLSVTGTVSLNNATLSPNSGSTAVGSQFVILQNDGSDAVVGTFNGLPENAIVEDVFDPDFPPIRYRITYQGGVGGNDVVLTRINTASMFPERSVTPVVTEGGFATLTGRIGDPDPRDFFILEVNWGDGTPTERHVFEPGSRRDVRLRHRYLDNPAGSLSGQFPIQLQWRDQHGEGNSDTLQVTVLNANPRVLAGGLAVLRAGQQLSRNGFFTDAGILDTHTARVEYGDGSGAQPLTLRANNSFRLQHRYQRPGVYQVTVTVTDDDGGIGRDTFTVRVLPRTSGDLIDALFALLGEED